MIDDDCAELWRQGLKNPSNLQFFIALRWTMGLKKQKSCEPNICKTPNGSAIFVLLWHLTLYKIKVQGDQKK